MMRLAGGTDKLRGYHTETRQTCTQLHSGSRHTGGQLMRKVALELVL